MVKTEFLNYTKRTVLRDKFHNTMINFLPNDDENLIL